MSGVIIEYKSGSRFDTLNLVDESQVRLQPYIDIPDHIGQPTYPFRYQGFAKEILVPGLGIGESDEPRNYLNLDDLAYSNNSVRVEGVVWFQATYAIPFVHNIIYTQTPADTLTEQSFEPEQGDDGFDTVFYSSLDTGLVEIDETTTPNNTLKLYLPLNAVATNRTYNVQGLIKVWEGLDRSSL
jgi:hypothetical protein